MEYVNNAHQTLSLVLIMEFASNAQLDQHLILLLIAVNYPLIQIQHVNWEQLSTKQLMLVNAHLEHTKVNPNAFYVSLHTNGIKLHYNAYPAQMVKFLMLIH